MPLNIPNSLTLFRIVAIPLVVLVFYLPVEWAGPACGLLFGLAALTDLLDGYLARKLGQTSAFGAFLDPVADKLMVATALVILVEADPQIFLALTAAIIIGREIPFPRFESGWRNLVPGPTWPSVSSVSGRPRYKWWGSVACSMSILF